MTYEAMFLLDAGVATNWDVVEGEINRLMERAGAELLCCRKWDDRRLAYEIKGRKRGFYVLVYFRADPTRIGGLERDVQLSEQILRVLVLRADTVSAEQIARHAQVASEQKAVLRASDKPEPKAAPESAEKPLDAAQTEVKVEPVPQALPQAPVEVSTDSPSTAAIEELALPMAEAVGDAETEPAPPADEGEPEAATDDQKSQAAEQPEETAEQP